MIVTEPKFFVEYLEKKGLSFFSGVPDSLLKDLCAYITGNCPPEKHIIAANEGAAVGLAAGYYLATGKPGVVYMQNSGTGNAINPLLSLADSDVYSIPMLLVIGWRGEPGIHDEPQHVKQGKVQEALLSSLGYRYEIMGADSNSVMIQMESMISEMNEKKTPVVLLVRKGSFAEYTLPSIKENPYSMTREDAIKVVLSASQKTDLFVSTTGMASREIYELREASGEGHASDFLTVGSMGHALMIASGIALFQKKTVYCIDGDGAAIMHLGSLGIAANIAPKNLRHIVINNGAHDSVGGQPTIGYSLPFPAIAKDLGYKNVFQAINSTEIEASLKRMSKCAGPSFLEIRVRGGARKNLGRPKTTPVENKIAFMENI